MKEPGGPLLGASSVLCGQLVLRRVVRLEPACRRSRGGVGPSILGWESILCGRLLGLHRAHTHCVPGASICRSAMLMASRLVGVHQRSHNTTRRGHVIARPRIKPCTPPSAGGGGGCGGPEQGSLSHSVS